MVIMTCVGWIYLVKYVEAHSDVLLDVFVGQRIDYGRLYAGVVGGWSSGCFLLVAWKIRVMVVGEALRLSLLALRRSLIAERQAWEGVEPEDYLSFAGKRRQEAYL